MIRLKIYSNQSVVLLVPPEDHCHRERNEEIDKKARKKLLLASTLCVIFMIAEIVGNTSHIDIRVNILVIRYTYLLEKIIPVKKMKVENDSFCH